MSFSCFWKRILTNVFSTAETLIISNNAPNNFVSFFMIIAHNMQDFLNETLSIGHFCNTFFLAPINFPWSGMYPQLHHGLPLKSVSNRNTLI